MPNNKENLKQEIMNEDCFLEANSEDHIQRG